MKCKINHEWLILTISDQFNGYSIEEFFKYYHLSKKSIHLLKQNKEYFLNNQYVPASTLLKTNDILKIKAYDTKEDRFIPQYYPLNIAYEDDFLLIINKDPGMNVHPDSKEGLDTLCNYVQYYYDINNYHFPVRYIHRLDYDTSGLIIFNKCQFIQAYLDYQLSIKNIKRTYLALVENQIKDRSWHVIENYIAKDRHVSNKMRVAKSGQIAITHYQAVKKVKHYTLVKCVLDTGRTHQIRVHLSSIGHPILGDQLYGHASKFINRQALHAYKLEFKHPITNKLVVIESKLPKDMDI